VAAARVVAPCAGAHQPHPHAHAKVDLGGETFAKPCNGRFWCTACRAWFTDRACVLRSPLKLPASWKALS
jgi:hypothetical protein